MNQTAETSHPPDICLMLRVHAEQGLLISDIVPVVRQLEQPGELDGHEVGPALSYLEVLWLEAGLRAVQTDAARERLDGAAALAGHQLAERARRYHVAVKRLRLALGGRVRRLTTPFDEEFAQEATPY